MNTNGLLNEDLEYRYIKCPICNGSGGKRTYVTLDENKTFYDAPCNSCHDGVKDIYRTEINNRIKLIIVFVISAVVYVISMRALLSNTESGNMLLMTLFCLMSAISSFPFLFSLILFLCSLINLPTILKLRSRGSSEEASALLTKNKLSNKFVR